MRRVLVENVGPRVKLTKTIFDTNGRELLASGMELRDSYINKLKECGIAEIYIEDDISKDIDVQDVVKERTRADVKMAIKRMMDSPQLWNSIDVEEIKEIVNKLIDELISNEDLLVNLSEIRSVDDYTFEHSVNVCILSLIMGIDLGFNNSRLKELGVGALLHDIGKLKVPQEILKKPSQLSVEEFDEIKKHTMYGYEILKKSKHVSMISAFIALGHHERYNGSGYPLQLKGEHIHQCARIVAIADVYDALTSDRVYRKKIHPHEVIEYISSLGTHHFDRQIVNRFVRYLVLYPVGTGVVLNTKERGLVVKANKSLPARPVIRVVYDNESRKLANYYEIDLAKKLNVHIVNVCEL